MPTKPFSLSAMADCEGAQLRHEKRMTCLISGATSGDFPQKSQSTWWTTLPTLQISPPASSFT
jgi:hypothetical protein